MGCRSKGRVVFQRNGGDIEKVESKGGGRSHEAVHAWGMGGGDFDRRFYGQARLLGIPGGGFGSQWGGGLSAL